MPRDRSMQNRLIIAEFRASRGEIGGYFADKPLLLVTTIGAKTGIRRTNPLRYLKDGDRYVVFGSVVGEPKNPDWYYNLVAHPDVVVEVVPTLSRPSPPSWRARSATPSSPGMPPTTPSGRGTRAGLPGSSRSRPDPQLTSSIVTCLHAAPPGRPLFTTAAIVLGGVNGPVRQLLAATCSAGSSWSPWNLCTCGPARSTAAPGVSPTARNMRPSPLGRPVGPARGHKKIILYANPGTEAFYSTLGCLRMNTTMAIWHDPSNAIESGLLAQGRDHQHAGGHQAECERPSVGGRCHHPRADCPGTARCPSTPSRSTSSTSYG
jgi:deazaflavin-dependent oxidoreductase (nitroreductase family)